MKLLFCPHCQDVRKLGVVKRDHDNPNLLVTHTMTHCTCGKSWGYYTDSINAVYGGDAVMLGISNTRLAHAIEMQKTRGDRDDGLGWTLAAFIIPESAPSVQRERHWVKKEKP